MKIRFRRFGRAATFVFAFALAACQTIIRSGAPVEDGPAPGPVVAEPVVGRNPTMHALACDLDGDGDLDIVACALLPDQLLGGQRETDFDALLWLEQIEPGKFTRHSLEKATGKHAAMDVGDFDGDGDIDLAVGMFAGSGSPPALSIWWNLRIDGRP